MSVKKEESGRRSIQVEVEVPGTPEEVWQAIASGPGISAWFVPTVVDKEAGTMTCTFGPGMDSAARITSWEAPHRFTADSEWGPGTPTIATEWTVEAKSGDTCVVRVVHSLFASTDDWDDQLIGTEMGWPAFFLILRAYLEHFRGQPAAMFQVPVMTATPLQDAWTALNGALGAEVPGLGARYAARGATAISGVAESVSAGDHPHLLVRLEEPAAGLALLSACAMGPQTYVGVAFYFYGANASAALEANQADWQQWLAAQFPPVTEATSVA